MIILGLNTELMFWKSSI